MEDRAYFAPWAVPDVTVCRRPSDFVKYAASSPALRHPASAMAEDLQDKAALGLFRSQQWDTLPSNTNKKQKTEHHQSDFICNAGGAVWSLDWCPSPGKLQRTSQEYLMAGPHPGGHTKSIIGKSQHGPAMLQLWTVLTGSTASSTPSLELAVCHQGGLTWDCKWCPCDASMQASASNIDHSSSQLPRLGLVAVALGSGDINILAVPEPQAAKQRLKPTVLESQDTSTQGTPLLVEMPAVAWLSSSVLGGSLPCTLEWLPAAPHDLLLVGCWDGTVAVIRLQPGIDTGSRSGQPSGSSPGQQPASKALQHDMVVLTHFQVDPLPIRAVAWCPVQESAEAEVEHRHLFLTAGHLGSLRLWDSREPSKPVYQRRISSIARLLCLQWTPLLDPAGILVGSDEGTLVYEAVHPQDEGQTWQEAHLWRQEADKGGHGSRSISREMRGTNAGAIWSVHCCPSNGMVAYAGESGEVAIFKERMLQDNRMRKAHTAVAGLQVLEDDQGLELRSAAYYTRHPSGLYTGSKPGKGKGLPHEEQSVHKVRWSPNGGKAAWLAHGGAAGLIWLQHLSVQ